MTREEAIEKLQKQKERYLEEWVDYSGVSAAYDMAIEALSNEQNTHNGDLISRQAVLDKAYAYGSGLEPDGFCVDVEDIQALPSAQPEIIFCKDCKWRNVYQFPPKYDERDYCDKHEKTVSTDDFCSQAERRTDD